MHDIFAWLLAGYQAGQSYASSCIPTACTAAHLCHQVTEVRLCSVSDEHRAARLQLPVVQLLIRGEQYAVTLTSDVTDLYTVEEVCHLQERNGTTCTVFADGAAAGGEWYCQPVQAVPEMSGFLPQTCDTEMRMAIAFWHDNVLHGLCQSNSVPCESPSAHGCCLHG